MSAAAIIAIRRKRLIRKFREAGATDPDHAVNLGSLRERCSWVFSRMVDAGVFLPTASGWYYMNEQAAAEFVYRKRMRAMIASGVLLLLFLALWACGILAR